MGFSGLVDLGLKLKTDTIKMSIETVVEHNANHLGSSTKSEYSASDFICLKN